MGGRPTPRDTNNTFASHVSDCMTSNRASLSLYVSFLSVTLLVCVVSIPTHAAAVSSAGVNAPNATIENESIDNIISNEVLESSGVKRVELVSMDHSISPTSVKRLRRMESVKSVYNTGLSDRLIADIDMDAVAWKRIVSNTTITDVYLSDKVRLPDPVVEKPGKITTEDVGGVDIAYGVRQINAHKAWEEFGTSGEGIKVAVIDGGVNADHPSIKLGESSSNNYKGSYAFFDVPRGESYRSGSSAPAPDETGLIDHGTHVAGIATGGDATGTQIGVAPNATLMQGVVAGTDGYTEWVGIKDIDRAIRWAHNNGADIISVSFGGEASPNSLGSGAKFHAALVQDIRNNGTIYVASSGNSGAGAGSVGALNDPTTSIGATDRSESVTSFSSGIKYELSRSNWLPEIYNGYVQPTPVNASGWNDPIIKPDFVAPGSGIVSASGYDSGEYIMTGTSMSAPHYAGSAAIVLQNNPDLTPDQVYTAHRITAIGNPDSKGIRYGHGIINTYEAVKVSKKGGYMDVTEMNVGDTVAFRDNTTISATVKNKNVFNESSTREVELRIEQKVIAEKEITLSPQTKEKIKFNHTVQKPIGERVNFTVGTTDDNMSIEKIVNQRSSNSGSVEITEVDIDPKRVPHPGGSSGEHTIHISVQNVSTDDRKDMFSVSMPDGVEVTTARLHSQSTLNDETNISYQDDKITVGVNPVERSNVSVTIRARIVNS